MGHRCGWRAGVPLGSTLVGAPQEGARILAPSQRLEAFACMAHFFRVMHEGC